MRQKEGCIGVRRIDINEAEWRMYRGKTEINGAERNMYREEKDRDKSGRK